MRPFSMDFRSRQSKPEFHPLCSTAAGLIVVLARDDFGNSLLHVAAQNNQVGCTKILIDRGANINAQNVS